jgi:predicted CoA-substrate-specific enzyme activase
MSQTKFLVGFDVGSTTVKAVVVDAATDQMIWSDYQRHETKQPEKSLELLQRIEADTGVRAGNTRMFITGSGGGNIGLRVGAKFVQEVNAVSLAVEKLHPEVQSVVELGGQDAKMIFFKEIEESGKKKKMPTMNDKCAGGTGAVIDKINAKLRIPSEQLCELGHTGVKLHPVAGKCGVFAESDINSLQKMGIPNDELMASLFESIIVQNLSVLTRGNTLKPTVLLLGGPNCYIKGMKEAWRNNIPKIWEERGVEVPDKPIEELIKVPDNAQYYAAIGAIEYGKTEDEDIGQYNGFGDLEHYIKVGRQEEMAKKAVQSGGGKGLIKDEAELNDFLERYKKEKFIPTTFERGTVVEGFIGLDGGSTSTKAVLVSKDKRILAKSYQLSKGNPIQDTIEVIGGLQKMIEDQGCTLEVLGIGTTGYAKDILKDTLNGDAAIVETVAHTESALHFYPDTDVIVDVGGQDIKVMILKNGRVKDFKLNTQCSAGNGYFLQSTAQGFGVPVEDFAAKAFSAKTFPEFGYGCAVFMQSDIVDFQRQGWKPEEIMAGLANVLPKNIWLYVSQIPNLSSLGTKFVLQGGTQHNMAAVKSQVDFIESRFKDKGLKPDVVVHKHCGEAGAIGAGIEAARLYANGHRTKFIGLDRVKEITYRTTRSEETRCYFCKNKCLRTFIDVKTKPVDEIKAEDVPVFKSKVPLEPGENRIIIATCEKGTVEDVNAMRGIKKGLDAIKEQNPNMVHWAAENVWKSFKPAIVADAIPEIKARNWMTGEKTKKRAELMKRRAEIKIGIPRVLNQYSTNPLFSAYFESLGIQPQNLIYSDYTDEKLYKDGAKRGAIDPCFPSKVGIPHVHNLIYTQHEKKKLDYIFFPMIDDLPTPLKNVQASRACPTVAATPEAVKAAFTKEGDIFAEKGIKYLDTFVNIGSPTLFERQMFEQFVDLFGLSPEENARACAEGFKALNAFDQTQRIMGREVIEMLERENRLGVVLLGRPYHNDPGINHEILEEFQKLGYPVLTQDSLPVDEDILNRLFGEDVERGLIKHPLDVGDAWKNSYSENTTRKVWAAKFTARHPNLVALELSSFKCGHDAPVYTVVEEVIEHSGTPYFCFKDIDENKPTGSIKIRLETMHYFLTRYREDMLKADRKRADIEAELKAYEEELRAELEGRYQPQVVNL